MILVFPIRCLCIWIACTIWSHDDITGDFYCSYARLFQYEVASVFSCAIVEKEGFLLVLLPDHFLARCLLTDVITIVNILCSSVARNAKIFVELIDIDRDLHFDFSQIVLWYCRSMHCQSGNDLESKDSDRTKG